jgi:hypothetical protein
MAQKYTFVNFYKFKLANIFEKRSFLSVPHPAFRSKALHFCQYGAVGKELPLVALVYKVALLPVLLRVFRCYQGQGIGIN